jgi:hypothetical protein
MTHTKEQQIFIYSQFFNETISVSCLLVMPLACSEEMPGSNLVWGTDCPKSFHGFPQSFHAKARKVP